MVPVVVAALVRLLARSWRVQADPLPEGPVVLALLHGEQLAVLGALLGHRATVVVSRSRDGEVLARTLADLGVEVLRGSSSRGFVRVLREGSRVLARGARLVLAVDGPRGPAGEVQPGAASLAAAAGCPLVALVVEGGPAWRASSWDSFRVPLPFARVRVRCIECPAEALDKVLASPP